MATVKTNLTTGAFKKQYLIGFTYYNPSFEKSYSSVDEFLKDFQPTKPSDNLLNRIAEEFNKTVGQIVFKPIGYKANQIFHFKN